MSRKKLKQRVAMERAVKNINDGFFSVTDNKIVCPQYKMLCDQCNFATNINDLGCDCDWFPVKDKITPILLRQEFPEYFI